jgi:DNA invertase Pin-like site-specific DNA recombinase
VGTSRPQLAKLLEDARRHQFDQVLVWKLDRWGRDLGHWAASVDELVKLKIVWVAVADGLETGPAMQALLVAMVTFGSGLKRDRIKASMRRAERRTFISSGRPKKVFDREKLFALRDAGKSIRVIAAELKIGRGTVQRLLLPARTGE